MTASTLKDRAAVFLALAVVGGTTAVLSPAMGQAPKGGNAGKPGGTDKDRLQGKWQITSIDMDGQVYKRGDKSDGWKSTFDTELVIQGDRLNHGPAANVGTFQLDDTQSPKQITFQDKDGKLTFRGIYAIDGDTVTLCVNGNGTDARRPAEFAAKEGTPIVLIALKKSQARN